MLWGQLPWRCEEDTFESARNAMLSRDPAAPSDSDLSPDMNAVLLKAVERDPGQRYNSPAAFALDLQRALGGKPVDARCPNLLIDAKAMADRHPAMAAIVVVATILLMVICFLLGTTLAGG